MGIKGNPSTTYHPQTDGQMERVNQSVKEFLTMFVNNKQNDWSNWLAVAQFCHNDQKTFRNDLLSLLLNIWIPPEQRTGT